MTIFAHRGCSREGFIRFLCVIFCRISSSIELRQLSKVCRPRVRTRSFRIAFFQLCVFSAAYHFFLHGPTSRNGIIVANQMELLRFLYVQMLRGHICIPTDGAWSLFLGLFGSPGIFLVLHVSIREYVDVDLYAMTLGLQSVTRFCASLPRRS
jgi:hypothetical protein